MNSRIQLSLFVPPPIREEIEAVRRLLDPVQAALIPAHVTLCREDELEGVDAESLRARLIAAKTEPITLCFGAPERFQSHGILMPCIAGGSEFEHLRRVLLASGTVRHQAAHITLAHPRNPKSPYNRMSVANRLPGTLTLKFTAVQRIQQVGSAMWQVLEQNSLLAGAQNDA